jgi:hypothetical protein
MKQIVGVTVTPRTVAHWLMKGVKLPLFLLVLLTLILVAGRRAYAQDVQYAAAIKDAAVYQQSHVHELVPLAPDKDDNVAVVTLTNYTGYQTGWTQLSQDVWVTQVPQVKDICRTFPPQELQLDLRKLLGLPPDKPETNFVVFSSSAQSLFRPTPDPNTYTKYPCGDNIVANCGNQFPAGATDNHKAWIAFQSLSSFQIPGGYPWTHLGYTYHWGHGVDIFGPSEYVIRSGSWVRVSEIVPIKEYCASIPR